MESFVTIVKDSKPLTTVAKLSILDVCWFMVHTKNIPVGGRIFLLSICKQECSDQINPTQQISTYSKSTKVTLEKGAFYVQS